MAGLQQMRDMMTAALERKPDKTQRGIARATGIDATGVSRIFNGGRKIGADEWPKICAYLEIDPVTGSDLGTPALLPKVVSPEKFSPPSNVSSPRDVPANEGKLAAPSPGRGDLPVWGSAGGMSRGDIILMNVGEPTYTRRPGILEGVTGAFGVYVVGDSMEPALRQGWVVWVDPHRPVQPGDDVVIEMKDGQAYLKTLVQRTVKTVKCKQYNPAAPVEYPMSEVKRIHLVVGSTRVRA